MNKMFKIDGNLDKKTSAPKKMIRQAGQDPRRPKPLRGASPKLVSDKVRYLHSLYGGNPDS